MARILLTLFLFISCRVVFAEDAMPPMNEPAPTSEVQEIEQSAQPISYQGAFVKMMLTLVALIVLIILSVWMLRRVGAGRVRQANIGRAIKILEKRPISAKSVLYLIEVHGKKVVIAESQLEVKPITTVEDFTPSENA